MSQVQICTNNNRVEKVVSLLQPHNVYLFAEEEHTDSNDSWAQIGTPEPAQYVSICKNYACVSGPGRALHSRTLGQKNAIWRRLPYRALHLELSPGGKLVWKVDFGVAAALINTSTQGDNYNIDL